MLRSVLSNWFALTVMGILSFFLTPFMIHHLGDLDFGMWLLAYSLIGYSGLLEMGIRPTLQRFVGRLKALADREALNQSFVTALALTIAVGALIFGTVLSLAQVLPHFFGLSGPMQHQFRWLVVLLGLHVAVGLSAQLLGTYLCGLQRFDLFNLAAIVKEATRVALIVVALLRGNGVIAVAVLSLGVTVASLPFYWGLVRRVDPGLKVSWNLASWARARELLSFSFWMFLNNAGDQLRTYTDSIVIGRILGVGLITPFSVAARLMQYFSPIIVGMVSPMLPVMSELDGLHRIEELRSLFLRSAKITTQVALLIGSMVLLNGRPLLRFWVGDKFVSSYILLLILTAGYVVALAQQGSNVLLVATGRHRAYGLWTLGEGVANLVLSVQWGHKYGLAGVALGTSVPMAVVALLLQPWYTLRVLGLSAREYLRKSLARPVLVAGLFLVIARLGGLAFPTPALPQFVASIAWQTALFGLLAYSIGLTGAERQLFRERVRQLASA